MTNALRTWNWNQVAAVAREFQASDQFAVSANIWNQFTAFQVINTNVSVLRASSQELTWWIQFYAHNFVALGICFDGLDKLARGNIVNVEFLFLSGCDK